MTNKPPTICFTASKPKLNWIVKILAVAVVLSGLPDDAQAGVVDECNNSFRQPDYQIGVCTRAIQYSVLSKFQRAEMYINRAIAFGNKGNYVRVIEDFNKAGELKPRAGLTLKSSREVFANANYTRGLNYYHGKGVARNWDKAAGLILEAVGLNYQHAIFGLTRNTTLRAPEFLKAIQKRLKSSGKYRSRVDGKWGPGTNRAVLAHAGRSPKSVTKNIPSQITGDFCKKAYADIKRKPAVSAFALSNNGGICGYSWSYNTVKKARSRALAQCRKRYKFGCKVIYVNAARRKKPKRSGRLGGKCKAMFQRYKAQAGAKAFASGRRGCGMSWSYTFESDAKKNALASCAGHGKDCRIIASEKR